MSHSNAIAAAILGACVLGAVAIYAGWIGRYTMSARTAGSSYVFILDCFSGAVRRCDFTECEVLKDKVE